MVMSASRLESAKSVSGALPESKHITVQPVPKTAPTARDESGRKFQRQRPVTGTGHIFTELLLVRRENADATPPARNSDIPLLRVRCGLHGRIGKQNVIYRLAL